jgi:hypothetical protein
MSIVKASKSVSSRQQTVDTTALMMARPTDYSALEERFRLMRYVLPDGLLYRSRTNKTDFGRVHNTLRNQIDFPYKSFQYDRLDGSPHWAVYVLYPQGSETVEVTLPWFNSAALPARDVTFAEIPLHILLKLLHVSLFRGVESRRFVGRDNCYVYARRAGGDYHLCVQVELKGDPEASESDAVQEFHVIPHAKRFGRASLPVSPSYPVYGKRPVGDRFYFLQLRSGEETSEEAVYREITFPDRRARVKYYDPNDLHAGRGKIMADFIRDYVAYLRELGFGAALRQRTFTPIKVPLDVDLDLSQLGTVGIYDNRLARTPHPLSAYIALLGQLHPEITFVACADLEAAPSGGVLALLDAGAEDFEEGGLLEGRQDPYSTLYASWPNVPKQSFNVNPNDPNLLAGGDYLNYPVPQASDEDVERNLDVVLSELYQKCALIHGLQLFPLPLVPDACVFVRKRRSHGDMFTTAMWCEDGHLHFADLGDPLQSGPFYEQMARGGVDWDQRFEEVLSHHGRSDDLPEYDFILGQDLFVAIEDLHEYVLYDYAEIERRKNERRTALPIGMFKLADHYDQIRLQSMLPLEALGAVGLLDGHDSPVSPAAARSLTFYQQLVAYDALLDQVSITHPTISFDELASGEWLERIARIFGAIDRGGTQYYRRLLQQKYQRRGLFLSHKSQDVQLYQGIWRDETGAFIVGSPTSMNVQGQHNAHLVRRFRVLQGAGHFDSDHHLAAMGVRFVRPQQYTVVPYYFHLIDLYVDNIGRYLISREQP